MKTPYLLPALLLAPLLHANHRTIEDVGGAVAPLTVNLTLSETIGGYPLTEARKTADAARGITYPERITFTTTYLPDATVSALMNPFWWDAAKGNNYVERVTTRAAATSAPVVTAEGAYAIASTRYTNATLLADLVAEGVIPSVTGYRIVAVSFGLEDEVHYFNGTYTTHVNGRLYFFAEKGATDPEPVFLGAEYDDIYLYKKYVGFARATSIQSGKYTETFTGDPVEGGFDYKLMSQSLNGRMAADIAFFRPTSGDNRYQIRVGGLFTWGQRYDARNELITRTGLSGASLAGPAENYFVLRAEPNGRPASEGESPESHDHGYAYDYVPNGGNQGVATGSVKIAAETHSDSMLKYLNRIPAVIPH